MAENPMALKFVTEDELEAWLLDAEDQHDAYDYAPSPAMEDVSRLAKEVQRQQALLNGIKEPQRLAIFGMISAERVRQNFKYDWEGYSDEHKALVIVAEAMEVAQSVLKGQGESQTITELIQTASSAVRWLEQFFKVE